MGSWHDITFHVLKSRLCGALFAGETHQGHLTGVASVDAVDEDFAFSKVSIITLWRCDECCVPC